MLQLSTIDTSTLELLKFLMCVEEFNGLRLVGGTSLALQEGHRKSIDIDLFGSVDFEGIDVTSTFNQFKNVVFLRKSKNINILTIEDVKVDFVNYPYPWLQDCIVIDGIRLAGIQDIAAMKLAAITGRGSKKDFIDIFFLLKKFSLAELLEYYRQKYADGSEFLVIKSLTYFEDAESDPEPDMIEEYTWDQAKKTILQNVSDYSKL